MHFVFKCNFINNAPILGELSYMLVNICCFQLAFYPNDVSIWKTHIFCLGTLCAIMNSVEGVVYSLISLFFWYLLLFWLPQSCVDLGFWYTLDNSLASDFLVYFVFCPICISFGSWKFCACISTLCILFDMLAFVDPIHRMNSIKS